MTVLCDWCRHTPAFYTHKDKCGMDYPEMKGRDEDCADFDPQHEIINQLDKDKEWVEFVRFYGEPHPNITKKLRLLKKSRRISNENTHQAN
jgi:hypothetical protein